MHSHRNNGKLGVYPSLFFVVNVALNEDLIFFMKESHLFSDDKSKVFEAVLKLGVPYSEFHTTLRCVSMKKKENAGEKERLSWRLYSRGSDAPAHGGIAVSELKDRSNLILIKSSRIYRRVIIAFEL